MYIHMQHSAVITKYVVICYYIRYSCNTYHRYFHLRSIWENRPYGHKYNFHYSCRDTKHLRLDIKVCFYRRLFSDAVKPWGCILWPLWPLRGINETAWGAKLILTADRAYPGSHASLGHLLMEQHCHFCWNVCFSLPTAPYPPLLPTPYRLNLR